MTTWNQIVRVKVIEIRMNVHTSPANLEDSESMTEMRDELDKMNKGHSAVTFLHEVCVHLSILVPLKLLQML